MALLDEDGWTQTRVGRDPLVGVWRLVQVDGMVELESVSGDLAGLAILELDGSVRDRKNTDGEDETLVFDAEELTLTQFTGAEESARASKEERRDDFCDVRGPG